MLPRGSQAKLSPAELADGVIPILSNRRLEDEIPDLWVSIKKLFKARNTAVHQGVLPEGTPAVVLVQRARVFVRWIEELEVERRDD